MGKGRGVQVQEERLVASEPRGGDRVTVQRNEHVFGDLEGTQHWCGGREDPGPL